MKDIKSENYIKEFKEYVKILTFIVHEKILLRIYKCIEKAEKPYNSWDIEYIEYYNKS